VDTPEDARAARVALRRSLGKDADGSISRWLNRPVSTRLSMALAPLRPAPDLVSLVAFALGLAGAALLAAGQGLAGALLVHANSVADGMDGEVARLQLRGGPRGALLDGVLDRVTDAAALAGLGLWALDGHDARGVLVLTVAATAGALLSMASKDRAAALGLPPAPERAGLGWLLGGRDGRLLLVAVGALLGAPSRSPGRGNGHLGAVTRPESRLPAPPAGRLTAPAPPQLRVSEQHHSVQYPRDDIGAEVVGQAFSSAPPRSNTDQSGHAFLWSAEVVVAGTR
jgi:phosphatidylglycerophosphate synthase